MACRETQLIATAPWPTADAGFGDGDSDMALAGSCAADEDSIALLGKEGAGCQIADVQLFVAV